MANALDESDLDAFRKFVVKFMFIWNQLEPAYHDDRFLKGVLLTAV